MLLDTTQTNVFDDLVPETVQPTSAEPEKKTRKTRTPKETKGAKKDADLSTAVYTVGALIIGLIGKPELALTKEETDGLATAANKVVAYYDLPDTGLIGAWVNLGLTIGAIVYPRYAVLKAEKESAKTKEKTENGDS